MSSSFYLLLFPSDSLISGNKEECFPTWSKCCLSAGKSSSALERGGLNYFSLS